MSEMQIPGSSFGDSDWWPPTVFPVLFLIWGSQSLQDRERSLKPVGVVVRRDSIGTSIRLRTQWRGDSTPSG